MARLLVYLLNRPATDPLMTILNVTGRGEAITIQRCAEIAHAEIKRVPNAPCLRDCFAPLVEDWDFLDSAGRTPLPHRLLHMDTTRLQEFLGAEYPEVIRYTVEDALRDSFAS